VAIQPDNFASIAVRDTSGINLIVNTNIQGIEELQIDDLRRGADVLFSFVKYSDGNMGFFVTRVHEENGRWIATLRTLGGGVITTDASVNLEPTAKPVKLTVDWDDGPCIDVRFGPIIIKGCVPIDIDTLLPLRLTQGGYESQMTEAFSSALPIVRDALATRSRNGSQSVVLVSRGDVLYAVQIHSGVANWTIEEVSRQPIMTCFVEASVRPDLSGRIQSVVIQRDGDVWTSPNLPGTRIVFKMRSSVIRNTTHSARLNDNSVEVTTDIGEYEVGVNIPLQ
jgi:hypothetical protein